MLINGQDLTSIRLKVVYSRIPDAKNRKFRRYIYSNKISKTMKKVIVFFALIMTVLVASSCQLTGDSMINPADEQVLAGEPSDGGAEPTPDPD